jgi:cytoskeletal protein CcmA (bactofilin family)
VRRSRISDRSFVKTWLGRGAAVIALGALVLPAPLIVADLISTNIYILSETDVQGEDASVAAEKVIVDGVVDGDLNVVASSVTITGTIKGDLLVASSGPVSVTGTIEGSIRGAASQFVVDGVVEGDVTVAAMSFVTRGTIERDVLVFGNSLEVNGTIGRNLRGRVLTATIGGTVGRDVDMSTDSMTVDSTADIGGDLIYRSPREAHISGGATIGGLTTPITAGLSFPLSVYVSIATFVSWLGFLVGGLVIIYLFRSTTVRATVFAEKHPFRSLGYGVVTVVLGVTIGGALALTLVGIPLSIALFALAVVAIAFAPVPVLAAVGARAIGNRGGIVGGFLAGAVAMRVILGLVPAIGVALYLATVLMGVGSWIQGAWQQRSWGLPQRAIATVAEQGSQMPDGDALTDSGESDTGIREEVGPTDERP